MPPGRKERLKAYTTALGTKAYVLHSTPFDGSNYGNSDGEKEDVPVGGMKCRSSASLGPCRNLTLSKPKSHGKDVVPPAAQRAFVGVKRKNVKDTCFRSPSKNKSSSANTNYPSLRADFARLLPTKVVVPPLSTSALPADVRPASVRAVPDAGRASLEAVEVTVPSLLTANIASALRAPEKVKSADIPLPLFASSPHINYGVVADSFCCSADDHQEMVGNGFVYCPQCGVKLRHGAQVDYLPADCPVSHERGIGGNEEGSKYCFLCGASMGVFPMPPPEFRGENPKEGNTIGVGWNRQLAETGMPKATFLGPTNTMFEGTQAVKMPFAPASAAATSTTAANVGERKDNERAIIKMENLLESMPVGMTEAKAKQKTEWGGPAVGSLPVVTPLSTPLVAAAATSSKTADKLVGFSPRHSEGKKQEKSTQTSVPTYASFFDGGEEAKMPSSTPQKEMLYTVGVPGVSCGLPHCALCEPCVDPPLPPVFSTQSHFSRSEVGRRDGANVCVVHNHYYQNVSPHLV
ncbi:hypothetical protein MOQ_005914 [Trypanosoma cruzi marinkellei]|uniref:Uncharacterized protein n=1 Tax=Trypanosoma cruzi marinkellei TaxID=85056 RepID=K2M5U3_TRYCR|nr:hypothetical protein MOQ_005914 [Trypanosoma cruzi marinkellei]